MTELPEEKPCEKKDDQPGSPCSEPPTDAISKIMGVYDQIDKGMLPIEDAANQITGILKEQREKKLECLKKLNL